MLNGVLEAYYESGWDGQIAFAFQFEGNKTPFFLTNGQILTIYDNEGKMLWHGKIQFVKREIFDNHKLKANIWSDTKQKHVAYGDWLDWFWRQPPLKARLELSE